MKQTADPTFAVGWQGDCLTGEQPRGLSTRRRMRDQKRGDDRPLRTKVSLEDEKAKKSDWTSIFWDVTTYIYVEQQNLQGLILPSPTRRRLTICSYILYCNPTSEEVNIFLANNMLK